jgi:hypothetical protein
MNLRQPIWIGYFNQSVFFSEGCLWQLLYDSCLFTEYSYRGMNQLEANPNPPSQHSLWEETANYPDKTHDIR